MIHISYGLYDRDGHYSKFVGVSIMSMFEHTKEKITVHILTDDNLTEDNRKKFETLAEKFDRKIIFYNVGKQCKDKLDDLQNKIPALKTSRMSVGAMYRLLMVDVIPENIDKIIYLDADTLVNLDINELWQIDLQDKPFAAAPEISIDSDFQKNTIYKPLILSGKVKAEDYFNSGVLLMSLDCLRKPEIQAIIFEGAVYYSEHPELNYFDQDILNYRFAGNYLKLQPKFNFLTIPGKAANHKIQPAIYHYCHIFLEFDTKNVFNRLWFETFMRTDWYDIKIFGQIHNELQDFYTQEQNLKISMSMILSGKRRSFFTVPQNFGEMAKHFMIGEKEKMFDASHPAATELLIQEMKKNHKTELYFLLVGNFGEISRKLTAAGFREGFDYVDATLFFAEKHGRPVNTHFIVQRL